MLRAVNDRTGVVLESYPGVLESLTFGLFGLDLPGQARQVGPVLFRDDNVWKGLRYVRCQGGGWTITWGGDKFDAAATFLRECDELSNSTVLIGGLKPASNILSFLMRYAERDVPEEDFS